MARLALVALPALLGCAAPSLEHARWEPLETGSTASLRGVCAVGDGVVWASGSEGTVLRSLDDGATWQQVRVPGPDSTDVRDIEALDAHRAWAMCITEPAQVLYTDDGGTTWTLRHEGAPGAFFDSIALFDDGSTVLFGDPQHRIFDIARSPDGLAWSPATSPVAHEGEAAFAASGTCVVAHGDRHAWIGTGGMRARVLRSDDGGRTWTAHDTPMRQGEATRGIYSVAFADSRRGVIVGGDYTKPEVPGANAAYTTDGGATWRLAAFPPHGYRSCVAYLDHRGDRLLAVGRAGSDYSTDGGVTWQPLGDDRGYYAISVAPDGAVFAVGADGRAARLVFDNGGGRRS